MRNILQKVAINTESDWELCATKLVDQKMAAHFKAQPPTPGQSIKLSIKAGISKTMIHSPLFKRTPVNAFLIACMGTWIPRLQFVVSQSYPKEITTLISITSPFCYKI